MSERIEKKHIISEEALQAPLEMAKNLETLAAENRKLISTLRTTKESLANATNFNEVRKGVEKLGQVQKDLNAVQKQIASEGKVRAREEVASIESIIAKKNQLQKRVATLVENQKEDTESLKRHIITRKEYERRLILTNVAIKEATVRIAELNKTSKEQIILSRNVGSEYQKLTISLDQARIKYKNLAASGVASNQQLKEQHKIIQDLNAKVISIDRSVGQFQRNVGNYGATFEAAGQSLRSFLSAFGLVSGVLLFAKTIKEIISLNVEFAATNSKLAAILGKTSKEITVLTEQQKELALVTSYTANEYANLQVELAKLGFPTEDIEKMTESTAKAAIAMGSDLAEQAELTGTVLRSFELEASRTGEVNDQLAKSTTLTALNFRKLADGLPYIATNAKLLGFSLDETLALMGRLSNTGLHASTIGTSLRSILLKLADSSSALSKSIGEPVRDLPTFINGLKKLKDEGVDLGEALELSDKRSVSAFASLLSGVESIDSLAESIKDANGFANQLAGEVMDNLKGDFVLLTSAAQELGRGIGESVDGALRKIVVSATTFIHLITALPRLIRENKDLLLVLGLAILSLNVGLIKTIASTIAYEITLKRMIIAEQLATISTKKLTAALLANPIGLIIAGFAALALSVSLYDRNSRRALDVEEQRNNLNNDIIKQSEKITKAQKDLNVSVEDWLKMSVEQRKSAMEQRDATIRQSLANIALLKTQKARLEETAKELTLWQQIKVAATSAFNPVVTSVIKTTSEIENATEATEGMDEAISNLEREVDGLTQLFDANTLAVIENAKHKKKASLDAQKSQLELDKFRLEQQIKIEQEIVSNEKKNLDDRLAASVRMEKLRAQVADVERKQDLLKGTENQAERVLIEEETQAKKTDAVRAGIKEREKINDDDIKKATEEGLKRVQLEEDLQKLVTKQTIDEFVRRQEEEEAAIKQAVLDGLISKERANKLIKDKQLELSEELLDIQLKALQKQLELESDVYFEERKKLVNDSNLNEAEKILAIQALEAESAEERSAILQKMHDLRIGFINEAFDQEFSKYDKEIEVLSKIQNAYESFGNEIMNIFNNVTMSRLQNLDMEIQAVEEYTQRQIELAGDNDKAKAAIEMEGQRRIEVLQKKRREEQRRAAIREKAFAIVSAAISTSLAVLNALSTVHPYPAAVIAAISAAALGAVQVAAIASKPIPQYAEGTAYHPGGDAIVGEAGAELTKSPSGEFKLIEKPSLIKEMERGTKVFDHKSTVKMLANNQAGIVDSVTVNYDSKIDLLLTETRKHNKELVDAVKNTRPSPQPNFIKSGSSLYMAVKNRQNHTKLVRQINFGRWFGE